MLLAIFRLICGGFFSVYGHTLRFKHDAENVYFEFEGVKRGTERLFPEILIDPKNQKSEGWEPG